MKQKLKFIWRLFGFFTVFYYVMMWFTSSLMKYMFEDLDM